MILSSSINDINKPTSIFHHNYILELLELCQTIKHILICLEFLPFADPDTIAIIASALLFSPKMEDIQGLYKKIDYLMRKLSLLLMK